MTEQTAVPVTGCGSVAEAVNSAGIIVTATSSVEPVLRLGVLRPLPFGRSRM